MALDLRASGGGAELRDLDVVAERIARYRSLGPVPRTGPVASIVARFDEAQARLKGAARAAAPAAQLSIDDVALVDGLDDADVFPERVRDGATADGGERG